MHPWTNDLGWVISDLGNVFVGKMDSVANDTEPCDEWLQSRGIPNLFFLPKDRKKDKSAKKIGFGESGEDKEGPCPARIEAFVRFIHRKMEGTKFNVENAVKRGCLIQGQVGFLSEKVPGEDKTWLAYLKGDVLNQRGPYITYVGLDARCKKTKNEVSKPWKKALKAAALYKGDDQYSTLVDCTAVDLVIVKFMHQLWTELKGDGLTVMEADATVASARKFAKKSVNNASFVKEVGPRQVWFSVEKVRIINVDTTMECFEASFELYMRWGLHSEDVSNAIAADADSTDAFRPPPVSIRNAKGTVEQDNSTKVTCM